MPVTQSDVAAARPFARMRRRTPIALAGVLLLLAGCAPVAEFWPDSDEEQAELGLMPPAQVFHGICDRAFGLDDLGAAFGTPLVMVDTTASPSLLPVLSGGTTCLWNSADGVTVSALFLPSEAVDYTPLDGCGEISYYNTPGCFLEATSNGIRLSGFVHRAGLSDTDALAVDAARLVALFTENATEEESAPVPNPVVGAWPTPADCEAVLAGVDFAAAFGVDAEFALGQSAASGVPYSPAEVALWNDGQPPICGINKTSDDFHRFDFEVFGGARWMAEQVALRPGAVKVEVEGLELVFKTDVGTEYSTVDVFDGVNYLRLSGLNMEANYPAIRAMIEYFNGE